MRFMRRTGVVLLLAIHAGASDPLSAARKDSVPPLPREEIFVDRPGLSATLLAKSSLHVGEDPQFKVRIANGGARPFYISPRPYTQLFITTIDGRAVEPRMRSIEERVSIDVRPEELVRLEPRREWTGNVTPGHSGPDGSARYAAHGTRPESGWVLLLPPGEYLARLTYFNVYDPYRTRLPVWEGRTETPPVRFSVVSATSEELALDLARIAASDGHVRSLLQGLAMSAETLLAEFKASPSARMELISAAGLQPPAVSQALLEMVKSLPDEERRPLLASGSWDLLLLRVADCPTLSSFVDMAHSGVLRFRDVFEKKASSCPEVREKLRSTLQNAKLPLETREQAASLLGMFRNADDVPLLAQALEWKESRPHTALSGRWATSTRGAAIRAFPHWRRRRPCALVRALEIERDNSERVNAILTALADIGGPEVVAPLLTALSSTNRETVKYALIQIRQLRAPEATPRILELLRDSDVRIRTFAVGALRDMKAPDIADAMRAAVNDPDTNVQAVALQYLANHGSPSDLDMFLSRLESRDQAIGSAAKDGIVSFSTGHDFPRIRALLEIPHGRVHNNVQKTLEELTFAGLQHRTPKEWDKSFRGRRAQTRTDWAREALHARLRSSGQDHSSWVGILALKYLADQNADRFRGDFERTIESRKPWLRVEAARIIGRADRQRATALLIREFDSRTVSACDLANKALGELTGTARAVNYFDPAARRRAKEEWARELVPTTVTSAS